ncbi:MAG TPA: hypothetical protein VJQ56_07980 [Blastocatellia bacterium]|nr:hypothetical protein [Blastocatellia bacterium]
MNSGRLTKAIKKMFPARATELLRSPKSKLSRRGFTTLVIVFSLGSMAAATFVAQRAAQKAKTRPQSAQARQRAGQPLATQTQLRAPDPNRAPQNLVDDAMFTNEDFFGVSASVARPYSVALERVTTLLGQYPKDSRLHLNASHLAERVG